MKDFFPTIGVGVGTGGTIEIDVNIDKAIEEISVF